MTQALPRTIKVFNTLTKKKQTLTAIEPGHIRIYACGVTVYDYCHIGHAMQAIFFDVIRNYLQLAGYRVTYVRNYTDVDDKIIERAQARNMEPNVLAQEMIDASREDMALIQVPPADVEPRVSESISEIIVMIEDLIHRQAAYSTKSGDVYYRVRSKADYGKLSNRNPDELRGGTRAIAETDKEDDLDFALWKACDIEGASWDSPWGRGRPGWHIECSAMAKMYLGASFDIHGGGLDLVFPHHENEIAQSESANGCSYASVWLHSGLLRIDKQKMSKSLGNHLTIREFCQKWPGEVLRLAFLQQHYSSQIDFSQAVFQGCAKRLLFFYETLERLDQVGGHDPQESAPLSPGHRPDLILEQYHVAMSNDFSTPEALRDLLLAMKKARELVDGKKSLSQRVTAATYRDQLRIAFENLGLLRQDPQLFLAELRAKMLPELGITPQQIEAIIQDRHDARASKNFARADELRDQLLQKGICLMDSPEGTNWSMTFHDI